MRKYAWTLFVVGALATTGCNQAELKKALADAKSAEAQKDSLLTEVLETTQFVTDINGELAKAKSLAVTTTSTDPGLPGARKDREDRKAALERVNAVIAKLNESEAKLAETETRAKSSRQRNARLLAQIETYKKTIDDLRTTAEAQKADFEAQLAAANTQIATLAGRVDTLTTEKGQLESDKAALTDTVVNLTAYKNTVYYAIGTKDELMKKGDHHQGRLEVPGLRRHPPGAGPEPEPRGASRPSTRPPTSRSRCRAPTRSTRSCRGRARPTSPPASPRTARSPGGRDRAARGVLVGVEVSDSRAGLSAARGSQTPEARRDGHPRVAVVVSGPRHPPAFRFASSCSFLLA